MLHKSRFIIFPILLVILFGCAGLRSKVFPPKNPAPPDSNQSQTIPQQPSSTSDPKIQSPDLADSDKIIKGGVDQKERAQVNQAALEFVQKNVPDAKHIKTCYSKLYGGWYMLLYLEKGKKIWMQHWSWNQKSKEWEPVSQNKEISPKQLDFDLKGEVAGEKCFVLK